MARDKSPDRPGTPGGSGFGRPPSEHQFQKGRSGNPKGRPKGSANFSTDVRKMLSLKVPIERDGSARKISTQAASLLRLREKALKGDTRALDSLLKLASLHNGEVDQGSINADLPEEDQAILDDYVARARGEEPTAAASIELAIIDDPRPNT